MSYDDELLNEVGLLVSFSQEGELSDEQFNRLSALLKDNAQARRYYYSLMNIYARMHETESVMALQGEKEKTADKEMLNALLAEEKTAPAIDIPEVVFEEKVLPRVATERKSHTKKSNSVLGYVMAAAAMLLFVVYAKYVMFSTFGVATVNNTLNAVFAKDDVLTEGMRLENRTEAFRLKSGVVEIDFDYGARVVIEGPAIFYLNSAQTMTLNSGRVYAFVLSKSAKGFTVNTPTSRVVDMGTEFGVSVDYNGNSDIYMTRGKAALYSADRDKLRSAKANIITAGNARRVDSKGKFDTIPMVNDEFARGISTEQGVIWRGQNIDLADIVGGGCGLGTGIAQRSIDPDSGVMQKWSIAFERSGSRRYSSVSSAYIDGVFVPDGEAGAIDVTSAGDKWECPDTDNSYKYNIANSVRLPDNPEQYGFSTEPPASDQMLEKAIEGKVATHLMRLNTMTEPARGGDSNLFMHANVGITFDLKAIGKLVPGTRLRRFTSVFGISESQLAMEEVSVKDAELDVWVLVDGEVVFSRQDMHADESYDLDIELKEEYRYLTMVITDSNDGYQKAFDWGEFYNPTIELEAVK